MIEARENIILSSLQTLYGIAYTLVRRNPEIKIDGSIIETCRKFAIFIKICDKTSSKN